VLVLLVLSVAATLLTSSKIEEWNRSAKISLGNFPSFSPFGFSSRCSRSVVPSMFTLMFPFISIFPDQAVKHKKRGHRAIGKATMLEGRQWGGTVGMWLSPVSPFAYF
jgi:hypothetical protein